MAEQFADPESKRLMLWIAEEYEILAERADADLLTHTHGADP